MKERVFKHLNIRLLRMKRRRDKRITVDIDNKNQFNILKTLFNTQYYFPNQKIEVLETRKGYHLRIYIQHRLNQNFIVRHALGDDSIRIGFDEDRRHQGLTEWIDTAFNIKFDGKYISHEKQTSLLHVPYWTRIPTRKK